MKILMNPGLTGVVAAETKLSLVDGENGHLVYRGHWAKELAVHYSFEEIAYLLWYGQLPNEISLKVFNEELKENRYLPDFLMDIIDRLPVEMDMMSVLRTAISALGSSTFDWQPTVNQATKLTAITPTIISYRYRKMKGLDFIQPSQHLDHAANYLYMLTGIIPNEAHTRALTAYMILTMEHGMNASTFTARVISSTQSDMTSAISGAIGSMKGPLHGGAPTEVVQLLNEIGTKENAESYLRNKLENKELIMGFGHRVYKTKDPRAEALRTVTSQLAGSDTWLDLAYHVENTAIKLLEEYKPGRKLYTNVEFYAAAVLRAVGMPAELFTPTFTVSRIVGWTAHVIEQGENNKIFRPESAYVGSMPE
ncbi:citrate synthase/methylcitrate synthase [Bacillus sp. 31A1R]|uniref:Citrate synthase n=1 Tax=Robertmurraya mangrovi TaxID=3098077 RepID=A0ABU5J0K6_9BACI|nr:citrate synthase/methylcitrate synthase [Bacillus sp. 31A1R]MDZ5472892.1 citrate synthase/methylcitrate synthase [Bacillus sp. 31A1R]